jgi:hypothetical protein
VEIRELGRKKIVLSLSKDRHHDFSDRQRVLPLRANIVRAHGIGSENHDDLIHRVDWKNGPRIHASYGSQEFIAEFNAVIATKYTAPEGRLRALIQGFERSSDRSERTFARRLRELFDQDRREVR